MKRLLITGGPTNEFIDEVMKITNMSTGSFSISLANIFSERGYEVDLILNRCISTDKINRQVRIYPVETTEEMLREIEDRIAEKNYSVMIHTAAVGDYKADFSFLMKDLAEELFNKKEQLNSPEDIYNILMDPESKIDNSSKISSYQKDLTVKLGLTPKIISNLRKWMPDTIILGCKLLENVSKEELFSVAQRLCEKNDVDYIMANDLADLRDGQSTRYLVGKEGVTGIRLETSHDVFCLVDDILNDRLKK